MELCDLHTHSNFSDGACEPKELVRLAETLGLRALALTDHNTVSGINPFLTASKSSSVEAIAGVEISSDYNGKELHVLALFIENSLLDVQNFLEINLYNLMRKSNHF
ncbi:MAG: PHP domain-containing protein [Clostridia bacterium]|nr:PHP domain-containing protein [Clostridia bacterium]